MDVMHKVEVPAQAAPAKFYFQKNFQEAVRNGDKDQLEKMLEDEQGKINVNLYDAEGQTALHLSCLDGNLELVKVLVKFGADVRLANRDGWSALHIAAYGGHQDIALFLIHATTGRATPSR
ncbi:notch-regulated ankyrin repeat-containing protein-like [Liolophura sinensis]|uniref:notch-regulated ankyrin repeat-containing protein-like n=1 Tax=Liolophura sinensis TaxID=3198878 RepID=UPI0031594C12